MINHMKPCQIRELNGIQEGVIDVENKKKEEKDFMERDVSHDKSF